MTRPVTAALADSKSTPAIKMTLHTIIFFNLCYCLRARERAHVFNCVRFYYVL